MRKHLIDIAPTPASIASAHAHFHAIRTELAYVLHSLEDGERKHSQKLGRSNETWCMEVMEVVRQHPIVVPAGMSMAALERDLAAREMLLPLLIASRQITRLLEDTYVMLGVDVFNGARGLYKSMQLVADLHGLEEIVAKLSLHFARPPRTKQGETTTGTPTEPTSPLDTSASSTHSASTPPTPTE